MKRLSSDALLQKYLKIRNKKKKNERYLISFVGLICPRLRFYVFALLLKWLKMKTYF